MTGIRYPLCREEDLPEDGARGFRVETPAGTTAVLLTRRDRRLQAYRNRCPHTGINLDWVPDQFLDFSGSYLQCATHGALFRFHDGFCIRGPCAGQSLQALTLYRDGDEVGVIL